MKRIILAVGVLALVFVVPATAHNTPWGWTARAAENALVDSTLNWVDSETDEPIHDVVGDAACAGSGPSFRQRPGGPRLYKHFRCLVETIDQHGTEDLYWIRFHVINRHRYSVDFLYRP